MNSNRTNRSWRLRQRPEGIIDENDLELVTDEIPEIQEGQVLAKTIYFSLDPTNRIWMSDIDQYMEPVEIGDIMRAGGSLAIVEESKVPHVKAGDIAWWSTLAAAVAWHWCAMIVPWRSSSARRGTHASVSRVRRQPVGAQAALKSTTAARSGLMCSKSSG